MKKWFIATMVMMALTLSACTNGDVEGEGMSLTAGEAISSGLLIENIPEYDYAEKRTVSSVENTTYEGDGNLWNFYQNVGLAQLYYPATDEMAVWSVALGEYVLEPTEFSDVWIDMDSVMGAYIFLMYPGGEAEVFDIQGKSVLARDEYAQMDVHGRIKETDDETVYLETVEYILQSDYDQGVRRKTVETYEVDLDTGARTEYSFEAEFVRGDRFEDDTTRIDLADYGLEGYTMSEHDRHRIVYNENNEVVSRFTLPDTQYTENVELLLDGHLLYQHFQPVDNEMDFTITYDGEYVVHRLVSVDLTTGARSITTPDYIIQFVDQFMDEEGQVRYGYAAMMPISNRLPEGMMREVVLDKDGNIVYSLDGLQYHHLRSLNDEYFINMDRNAILDEDLNEVFSTTSSVTLDEEETVVLERNGKYGVVHYSGVVLVPFEYDFIDGKFYNGVTFATYEGESVLVGTNAAVTNTNHKGYAVPEDLFYTMEELDGGATAYEITYYDYGLNERLTLGTNYNTLTTMNLNNPFMDVNIHFFGGPSWNPDYENGAFVAVTGE